MRAMLPAGKRVIITWCTRCQRKIENDHIGQLRSFCDNCLPPAPPKVAWALTEYDIEMLRALPYPIDPT